MYSSVVIENHKMKIIKLVWKCVILTSSSWYVELGFIDQMLSKNMLWRLCEFVVEVLCDSGRIILTKQDFHLWKRIWINNNRTHEEIAYQNLLNSTAVSNRQTDMSDLFHVRSAIASGMQTPMRNILLCLPQIHLSDFISNVIINL